MEQTKIIPKHDIERAMQIINEYLPGDDQTFLDLMYEKYNHLFVGYYIDNELVGVCFGCPFFERRPLETTKILLLGIAIIHPFNAAGRGGKLIKYFEDQVKRSGDWTITLGSAGGYVERFYIKNGYTPVELKIEIYSSKFDDKYAKNKYFITNISNDQDIVKISCNVDNYYSMDKERITKDLNGNHSFFIFEKKI